jgi:hypothetical protein
MIRAYDFQPNARIARFSGAIFRATQLIIYQFAARGLAMASRFLLCRADFVNLLSHRLPTLRFAVARRRTDGAGGFLLVSIRCSFRRSPASRSLPIMFAGIWPALSWSSGCPHTNSSPRSAPASEALRRVWRMPWDSITTTPAPSGWRYRKASAVRASWPCGKYRPQGEYNPVSGPTRKEPSRFDAGWKSPLVLKAADKLGLGF